MGTGACCLESLLVTVNRTDSTLAMDVHALGFFGLAVYAGYSYAIDMGPLDPGHYDLTIRFLDYGSVGPPFVTTRTMTVEIPGSP